MNSLENCISKETDEEPAELTHDKSRSKTLFEMSCKAAFSEASASAIMQPKPDSTFSTPPSASRCLPSAWNDDGPNYNSIKSDQVFTESDSGLGDIGFTGAHGRTGYLLQCDSQDGLVDSGVDSIRDWTRCRSAYEVRQIPSSDPCFEEKCGDVTRPRPTSQFSAQPGLNMPSFESDTETESASSSAESSTSTTSLPSPRSTSISTPIDALPTFMSPVETIRPCPQYCRCHGYASLANNNHGNMIFCPNLPNTIPNQFSSMTSSTTCMTSPLVCPGPFQPPDTSFKPDFVDGGSGGRQSTLSTDSLFLVSSGSAPITGEMTSAPHGQDGAHPVEVVPSTWLTSLVQEGHVGKGIENNPTTPIAAIAKSASEADHRPTQGVLPVSFFLNGDKHHDEAHQQGMTDPTSVPGDTCTSSYSNSAPNNQHPYPRPNPFSLPAEYPAYPPPAYSSHFPSGYHPHPAEWYHAYTTPDPRSMYPTYPPAGYHGSFLLSRLASNNSSYLGDSRVEIPPSDRGCFPSHGDGRPRSAAVDEQKVEPHKRRPNRSGRRLVDQFPDILPVIAWCINYSQASTSSSHSSSKPSISMKRIQEIVIECIPGVKERGGIGITTIKKLVYEVKRKQRNKDFSDRVEATKTPTASVAQSLSSFMKENSDSISSSIMKEDDCELPRAPTESILRSVIEFVDNMPNAEEPSKSTTTTKASLTTSRNKISHYRTLDHGGQQQADANAVVVSSEYDNNTSDGSIFRKLMEAHNIIEDEVKRLNSTSDTPCALSSDCIDGSEANSPVKSSHVQPEIALAGERIDVANYTEKRSNDDIMVIDELSQNI